MPSLTPTPTLPADWVEAQPGLDLRQMTMPATEESDEARVIIARIDPARFRIEIQYDPDVPVRTSDWQTRLGATAVINAGFFQEDYSAAGLVVVDGEPYGLSFDQNGTPLDAGEGMFTVGSSGEMALRSLLDLPYDSDEPFMDAVQALPVLIKPGGVPGDFNLPRRVAWRSAMALDKQGRLLLINISQGQVTLYDLRDWLLDIAAELEIDSAMNLDGGPSTGLIVTGGAWQVATNSINHVPSVIAAYPR
jgi:exopolysaccharide biosynthesis protein